MRRRLAVPGISCPDWNDRPRVYCDPKLGFSPRPRSAESGLPADTVLDTLDLEVRPGETVAMMQRRALLGGALGAVTLATGEAGSGMAMAQAPINHAPLSRLYGQPSRSCRRASDRSTATRTPLATKSASRAANSRAASSPSGLSDAAIFADASQAGCSKYKLHPIQVPGRVGSSRAAEPRRRSYGGNCEAVLSVHRSEHFRSRFD